MLQVMRGTGLNALAMMNTMFQISRELETANDRSVAIVGGALVETTLRQALVSYLHPDKKLTKELFRSSGAFGAFGTKIALGKLVGMYGDAAYKELSIIKDIRNAFAHDPEINSFEIQKIRDWTKNFWLAERYTTVNLDPSVDLNSMPRKDWPAWISLPDRENALTIPRMRFIAAMNVLMHALVDVRKTGMPTPTF